MTVTLYSFILTVLVIWIHAVDPAAAGTIPALPAAAGGVFSAFGGIGDFLQGFLGSGLGQIAVPGFFCMSGYLFFRNAGGSPAAGTGSSSAVAADGSAPASAGCGQDCPAVGKAFFAAKWKRRVRTLVIPYLLWNLIYYVIYLAAGRAVLSLPELVRAVLHYGYNPVFWYLRELILITAVTPLIWLALKNKRIAPAVLAAVFLAAVYYDRLPVHLINEDALFYYMTGAALALHFGGRESDTDAMKKLSAVSAAVFVLCEAVYLYRSPATIMYGIVGGRIAGPLALFAGLSLYMDRRAPQQLPDWMNYNFWIYAVHYLEIRFFRLAAESICGQPLPEAVSIALYLLMPLLCIAAGVVTARLIRKNAAGVYSILTGGRSVHE